MPRSRLLLAALLLSACGGESPDAAPGASSSEAPKAAPKSQGSAPARLVASAPAPALLGEAKLLFPEPEVPKDAWNAENHARMDPRVDGWPLEALHDLVRPRMLSLAGRVWGSEGGAVEELLAAAPPEERRQVVEDMYWSLLTSREFLFRH